MLSTKLENFINWLTSRGLPLNVDDLWRLLAEVDNVLVVWCIRMTCLRGIQSVFGVLSLIHWQWREIYGDAIAAEKAYYASHHRWRFELSFWHNDSRETLAQIQRFPAPKPIYIYFKAWNCKHYRSCRKVDIIVQTEHPSIKFLSRWQHAANLPLLVQPARLACFMGVLSSFPLSACLYLRKSGASRLWITHSSQHSIKYLQSRW